MKRPRSFKYGSEINALEYEVIGKMKRSTDPKEIEQARLDEIERDRINEAYDLESERLEKEWKNSHPKSEHYLWRSDIEHMKAYNIPVGWLSDFWELEEHIPLNQDEYLVLAQKAMKEGDRPVYNLFHQKMIDQANVKIRQANAKIEAPASAEKAVMFAPLKTDDDKPARESFPLVALPKPAQDFCTAVSDSMQTPVDFAALGTLGAMACACGASTRLEVKAGWHEFAVLWLSICARPGAAKSPSLNACFKAVRGIQKELNILYAQAMTVYKERLAQAKKDPTMELPAKPVAQFLLLGDTTQEALVRTLAESPRGGAILSDEVTHWLGSHDKYSKAGNDRQTYLSLWSSLPLSVHRKLDGVTTVELPVLSVVGGLTPSSLPKLHGGSEDGFFSRFLIAYPDDRMGIYTKEGINLTFALAYNDFIKKLWELAPEHRDEHGITPKTIFMSEDAASLFESFYNEMQANLSGDELPSVLRGTFAKAPTQLARIALVLHCGRQVSGEESDPHRLSVDCMDAAILVTKYFLNQARVVVPELEHGATRAAKLRQKVLNWLKRNCTTEKPEADWNALRHATRRRFTNAQGVIDDRLFEQALEGLQASGHIALTARTNANLSRKATPGITVNPILLKQWETK